MRIEVLFLICLSVSLHELGHAFAMRRYGLQIKEICLIGLGGPRLFSFRVRRLFGETPITIRAFIFGGFVMPTSFSSRRVYCIDYSKAGHIYAGGIAINFLLGALLFLTHSVIKDSLDTGMVWIISVLFLLGIAPKYTFRLYPLLGLMLLVLIYKDLMYDTGYPAGTSGSLINTIRYMVLKNGSLNETLYLGGLISVALGVINCVPVLPSDGGKIIERMLCSISYPHRKLIIGVYKLAIIPLIILLALAFY